MECSRGIRVFVRAILAAGILFIGRLAMASTITVNSTADVAANDGQCTLREAIIAANTNTASGGMLNECAAGSAGLDTIQFSIAGTIAPASALPLIIEPIFIDGYSAPGSAKNTNPVGMGLNTILTIELNLAGTGGGGLVVANTAAGSIIQGLVVNRSPLGGITLSGASTVQGCFIGTNPAGTAAGPGNFDGIVIGSSSNLIGGTTPAARNLISGNSSDTGINFAFIPGESGNVIQGNLIGTNAAGTAAIANGFGIAILDDRIGNTLIGGTAAGAGNVISGNTNDGVDLRGPNVASANPGTTVQGNFIGTDVTGTVAIANGQTGVLIGDENANNLIGGTAAGAGNLISGNVFDGVRIFNTQSNANNVVQGNKIGTNAAGTAGVGGQSAAGISVFSSSNTIGGLVGGAPNLVAFNTGQGVAVTNFVSGVTIEENSIHDNGLLGILTVTPFGDPDMFAPTITAASISAGTLTVSGTHNGGTAGATIRLEFFSSAACDGSGFGEGQTFLGSDSLIADGSGNITFVGLPFPGVPAGQTIITATATSTASGSSSAFSACFAAGGVPPTFTPTPTLTPTGTTTPTLTPTIAGVPTATATPVPGGAAAIPTLAPDRLVLLALALALAAVLLIRRAG
jgi:CSLREA domain-containing protein